MVVIPTHPRYLSSCQSSLFMLLVSICPIYPQSFQSSLVVQVRMIVMTRMPRITGMTQPYVIPGFLVILVNFCIRVIQLLDCFRSVTSQTFEFDKN